MEDSMKHHATRASGRALGAGIAAALLLMSFGLKAQEKLGGRGRLAGRVIDENKDPIADVQIVVQSVESQTSMVQTKTDGRGNFVAGGLRTGVWNITAQKEGFQGVSQQLEVRQLRANPPVVLMMRSIEAAIAQGAMMEAGDQLTRSNQLLEAGNYAEARELLEKFRGEHPEAYQVALQIGMCWLKLGELEKGEAELRKLLDLIIEKSGSYEKDPDRSMQALAGLGEAAVRRNDIETGMKYFRQALEISPTNEILAYNVAEIFFSHQKTDEAIQYYLLAIQIKKEWPKPYNKLGIAYLNQGNFAKALEYLRQFVALEPDGAAAAEARNIIAAVEKMK
jgi:tetratricopeptide (TPR) repeat protein